MTWREIQALADRLEPDIRTAWLRAVRVLRARLTPEAVDRMLRAVTVAQLDAAIRTATPDTAFAPLLKTIEAGMVTSIRGATVPGVRAGFTLINPRAVLFARQHAGKQITAISKVARRVIRTEIVNGQKGEQTVQTIARNVRAVVGLTPKQAERVAKARAALEAGGATAEAVEFQIGKLTAEITRQRAITIARTESIRAANEGQVAAWRAAQAEGLLGGGALKRWIVTRDDRLCPLCLPMAGQVQPIEEDFVSVEVGGILAPPLHPNCRCAVALVVEAVAAPSAADAA